MLDHAHSAQDCILLFGMPRSGTTWLGKLFDSHPHVLYRHEPDTWRHLEMPRDADPADVDRYRDGINQFVESLPQMNVSRVVGKRPIFPKAYISSPRLRLMRASIEVARVGSRFYRDFPVVFEANGSGDPDRRVVWKSIESLARLGALLEALNTVRAVHILRHPCGYLASVLRGIQAHKFTHGGTDREVYGFVSRLIGTKLGDDLGFDSGFEKYLNSLTPEERIVWLWVVINEKASRECAGSSRYMRVRYEDICADPQVCVQRMFDFVGLEMNPQTREFISTSTGTNRDDYYSVFKDPQASAWRWQDELTPEVVDKVMAIAARSDVGKTYIETRSPMPSLKSK